MLRGPQAVSYYSANMEISEIMAFSTPTQSSSTTTTTVVLTVVLQRSQYGNQYGITGTKVIGRIRRGKYGYS